MSSDFDQACERCGSISRIARICGECEIVDRYEKRIDALIAERDARPEITPEDARIWTSPVALLPFKDGSEVAAALRINDALRVHAAKVKND